MADTSTQSAYEAPDKVGPTGKDFVEFWLSAIAIADKEEKEWREVKAREAYQVYKQQAGKARAYNILHANIETQLPSLYNSTPIPDIRPRFLEPDETAKQAGRVVERAISFHLDCYDFDQPLVIAVKHALITGRGVVRVRYAEEAKVDPTPAPDMPPQETRWQRVAVEVVPWGHFRRGPGTTWEEVPWVAFKRFLTRDELRRISPDLADKVQLDAMAEGADTLGAKDDKPNIPSVWGRACVWEIWDRATKTQIFIAPGYKDEALATNDDPYGLHGFYPCPRPLYAIEDGEDLVPLVPFEAYKKQAEELDFVTERIRKLTQALRYRGIYASEVEDIIRVKDADDGELVPSKGAMAVAMSTKGNLDGAIWLWPVDKLIVVLRELHIQREQIKQNIWEISGIADIMRGATDPRETATAQGIKNQWGTLRISRMQAEVQRLCCDVFGLMVEIMCAAFDRETLQRISQIEITDEIEALLRNDVARSYMIDVETDSTIQADIRSQLGQLSELMGVAGPFMQLVDGAVEKGYVTPEVAVTMFAALARKFKLGRELDDALDGLKKAAETGALPNMQQGQMAEAQSRAQQAEQDAQLAREQMAAQQKQMAAQMQVERENMMAEFQNQQGLEMAKLAAEVDRFKAEYELKVSELAEKARQFDAKIAADQEKAAADRQAKAEIERERMERDAELRRQEMEHDSYEAERERETAKESEDA